mmetsp:Transcript_39006/g.112017  ORF Transcript_39006/g.112017 Transcript_39006/m.112017 type:complete len:253 (-) Transcript_39006:300-1058(-)
MDREERHHPTQRADSLLGKELFVLLVGKIPQRCGRLDEQLRLFGGACELISCKEPEQRRDSPPLRESRLASLVVGDILQHTHDVHAEVIGHALGGVGFQRLQQRLQQALGQEVLIVLALLRVLEQALRDVEVGLLHARRREALRGALCAQQRQSAPAELEEHLRLPHVLKIHQAHDLPQQLRRVVLWSRPSACLDTHDEVPEPGAKVDDGVGVRSPQVLVGGEFPQLRQHGIGLRVPLVGVPAAARRAPGRR